MSKPIGCPRAPVIVDPTRMCELLVGVGPDVAMVRVMAMLRWLEVTLETRVDEPVVCENCATVADLKDRDLVSHVDLPSFGQPTRLARPKRRRPCPTVRAVSLDETLFKRQGWWRTQR